MSLDDPVRTLVVIPAFNEEATVASVVSQVMAAGYPVVVVDDGSRDRTAQEAERVGATVLRLSMNLGVGGALRCGFKWAVAEGYERVIQCDADGQHDPAQFAALVEAADRADAHLVVGTRFSGGGGFEATRIRRVAMRLLSRIASNAAGRPMTDATSGYRLISEPLLSAFAQKFPAHYLGDTFEVLVQAGRAGYRVIEVPVVMRERAGGVPSAGLTASLWFLLRALLVVVLGTAHRFPQPASADI